MPSHEMDPLIFRGRGPSNSTNKDELLFEGAGLEREAAEKDQENLNILNEVWKRIQEGELIEHLELFLPPQKEDIKKIIEKLSTQKVTESHCQIADNKIPKISIFHNESGGFSFAVQTNKLPQGLEPVTLMMACARCAVELEIDERVKAYIKQKHGDKDISSFSDEEQEKIREEIIKAHPKIFQFTINRCANADDVAAMLTQMKNGNPKLTATLTPDVIASVQAEMKDPKCTLSEEQKNIIRQQIASQKQESKQKVENEPKADSPDYEAKDIKKPKP